MGTEWTLETLLRGINKPGGAQAEFGVSLDGSVLASGEEVVFVGAQNGGNDGGELREGSAYAFTRDSTSGTWLQEARLLAPDGEEGDRFGHAVALLPTPGLPGGHPGDALALVGADRHPRTQQQRGAVYVLTRDGRTATWAFGPKLVPSDLQPFDNFGAAVTLAPLPGGAPGEALALIGSTDDDDLAIRAGAAYAFRRERVTAAPDSFRWVEEAKLLPARAGLGHAFGFATALALDTLASGAVLALGLVGNDPSGETGSHPGEASLFARTVAPISGEARWVRRAVYESGSGSADWFGHSVALAEAPGGEDVWALVGAYRSSAALAQGHAGGTGAGAVFVYDARVTVGMEETPEAEEALTLTLAPNPASGQVRVGYALAAPSLITLSVYDVLGRRMALVAEGSQAAGGHEMPLDVRRLPSGVYVVRLAADGRAVTRRLTIVR